MDLIKSLEKDKEISQDEMFDYSEQVQILTDKIILRIDEIYSEKEKDILQV